MTQVLVGVLAIVALTAGQTAEPSGIAGTWNMSLNGGDHVVPVGLVLEQDGRKLTGTLMMMGKEVPLEGEYVEGALKLTGSAQVTTSDGHGSGPLKITGTLEDDGTMAGEFETPRGPMPWTAERLKKRK